MFRKTLLLLTLVGLMASLSVLASAFFTSEAQVSDNQFTTGTVDLTLSPTTSITLSNLAPIASAINGPYATFVPLTITNSGTLPLRYAMTTSATNQDGKNLAGTMYLHIRKANPTCSSSTPPPVIYSGRLAATAIGQTAQGEQAGDRVLQPDESETLCFMFSVPINVNNSMQGATTTADFTFVAEQIANNP